jgi:two-component system cell cycle response regulator DivK
MKEDSAQMQILIVDDNERNIFALSAVLQVKGYACVSAASAKVGLDILATHNDIGVVLVDMMMPEMDGYEMIARIKRDYPNNLPVIAVTAQAMTGDRERCLAAGADGYIPKPIDINELLKLLSTYNLNANFSAERRASRSRSQ